MGLGYALPLDLKPSFAVFSNLICVCAVTTAVGIVPGIVGIVQRRKRRLFAVLGIILNLLLVFVSVLFLIFLALSGAMMHL